MLKVREAISGIFSKNRSSQLETDAAPIPDSAESAGSEQIDHSSNSSRDRSPSGNVLSPTSSQDLALIAQSDLLNSQQLAPVDLYNTNVVNTNPTTNNVLAVNNTQGQVVYQFSHIKGLHMGSVFNITTNKEGNANERRKRQKTKTVDAMIRSQDKLAHRMLDCISTHLGEGWQCVMRELNYSDGQIHQAKVDYGIDGGLKEIIYQLLLDWSRNDDNATIGKITQVLWKGGHFETVKYMKEAWKAEKSANPPKDDVELK